MRLTAMAGDLMVEAGESRTPVLAIPKVPGTLENQDYSYAMEVLKLNIQHVNGLIDLQADLSTIMPLVLSQLIMLGHTAHNFKQMFNSE